MYVDHKYVKKKVVYLKKTPELWPLIVYKSKQAKPDTNNIFQVRFKVGEYIARGYQIYH